MSWSPSSLALLLSSVVALAGCGYHVSGKADLMPASVHTIAVPAFANLTTRYKLTDQVPEAVAQEFIARTRYRVVPDAGKADAVLHGTILNYWAFPIIFDQRTGRATALQASVTLSVTLNERTTGKVLYTRQGFEMRQRYEISENEQQYFDESDAGLQRLSRDAARAIVSGILENF